MFVLSGCQSKLLGAEITGIYFLPVLRLDVQDQGVGRFGSLEASLLGSQMAPSCYVLTWLLCPGVLASLLLIRTSALVS